MVSQCSVVTSQCSSCFVSFYHALLPSLATPHCFFIGNPSTLSTPSNEFTFSLLILCSSRSDSHTHARTWDTLHQESLWGKCFGCSSTTWNTSVQYKSQSGTPSAVPILDVQLRALWFLLWLLFHWTFLRRHHCSNSCETKLVYLWCHRLH